jgi:hypothetical protein
VVKGFETAFYVSAENYTSLGYGDFVLSPEWRLLGPLEAINGLLLFGLSTAVLFAVMSRLVMNHLRARLGQRAAVPGGEVAEQQRSACAGEPSPSQPGGLSALL